MGRKIISSGMASRKARKVPAVWVGLDRVLTLMAKANSMAMKMTTR